MNKQLKDFNKSDTKKKFSWHLGRFNSVLHINFIVYENYKALMHKTHESWAIITNAIIIFYSADDLYIVARLYNSKTGFNCE